MYNVQPYYFSIAMHKKQYDNRKNFLLEALELRLFFWLL